MALLFKVLSLLKKNLAPARRSGARISARETRIFGAIGSIFPFFSLKVSGTHTQPKTVLFIGIIFRQGVKLLVFRFILVATLDPESSVAQSASILLFENFPLIVSKLFILGHFLHVMTLNRAKYGIFVPVLLIVRKYFCFGSEI